MENNEDRYSSLHKKIQQENRETKKERIYASELEGQVVKNLKLLKSLIQSEKVKSHLFEKKNFLEKRPEVSSVEILQNKVIEELKNYSEKELAKFAIHKKYMEECFELLVSAWRQKINQKYAQTLTFTSLHFSKESYRAFIIALSLNVTLKALRLERCHLKEYEMKLLAVLIKIHPSLTFLHLDKNPIHDEGLLPILAALKLNERIQHLSLIQTNLTDISANEIIKLLANRPLKSLNLDKNNFSETSIIELIKIAERNECTLTYNEVNESDF